MSVVYRARSNNNKKIQEKGLYNQKGKKRIRLVDDEPDHVWFTK
jgi:hypothetical protein